MGLWKELRRRNVIRVAGLYLVGAWLIVQVAETVLPIFETPGWVLKALVVLLALGFVPALVASWIFEFTPQGLRRDAGGTPADGHGTVDRTARKLDIAVIAMLAVVGGMIVWQQRSPPAAPVAATAAVERAGAGDAAIAESGGADGGTAAAGDAAGFPAKSIAVLPFADFSPGGGNAWFADGLSEEILNALARTPDLQVAARTSSFRYRDTQLSVPEIAAELRVAHVLEGSVRSTPERIRVTAQLIRAADGFHLWSQNYDRDAADVIGIQEDLAKQIATAMQTSMDPEALADMASVGTRSVEAYQAYLRGVALTMAFDVGKFQAAYEEFEKARALDPAFAAAHARAANYWLMQLDPTSTFSGLTDVEPPVSSAEYLERIDLAISHAGTDIERLRYRASKAEHDLRLRDAAAIYREFLAARPGDRDALGQLLSLVTSMSDEPAQRAVLDELWPLALENIDAAISHVNSAYRAADRKRAADEALRLVERWPDNPNILYQAHRALLWDGRVDTARAILAKLQAVSQDDTWATLPPARQACADGRRAEVEQALAATAADDIPQRWHLLMLLGRRDEAADLLQAYERAGNTYALSGFLAYRVFDPRPFPSLMRVLEREGVQRPPPLALPYECPPP